MKKTAERHPSQPSISYELTIQATDHDLTLSRTEGNAAIVILNGDKHKLAQRLSNFIALAQTIKDKLETS